jgi:hypothetical protein
MGPTVHLAAGFLLILLAVVLAGGILLIGVLLRPRRRGTTPHCARCDYNLTGLVSDRCPECGTEMTPASIVYGELVRRPWAKVLVGVIVVALLVPAVRWAWSYDWYHLRPTAWVLSDLQSSNPTAKSRAWTEMDSRIRAGSLSASQESRLIDVCLREQTAGSPQTPMIDHLGASLLGGRMNQTQKATFFKQIVQMGLVVRPTVIAGGSIPIEVRDKCRGPSQPGLWITIKQEHAAMLDAKAMKRSWGSSSSSGMSGCGAGGSSSWSITLDEWAGPIAAGQHRLAMVAQMEIWDNYPEAQKKATCLHRAKVPLEAGFELLAAEPAGYIKLIDDPSQKAALQSAIQPRGLRVSRQSDAVEFTLEFKSVPVSIAFDVLARTGGREQHIGAVHLAKGQSTNWSVSAEKLEPDRPFDLILRSSKKVAADTVDLFEMWQGEVVYPNLRVEKAAQPQSSRSAD